MSFLVNIQPITRQEIPFWFTSSDSKFLRHQLLTFEDITDEPLYKIVEYFQLNLEPLSASKIVYRDDDVSLEDFISRNPENKTNIEDWHKGNAEREAAWQSPEVLINSIDFLIKALNSRPSIFRDLEIENRYFTSGVFRQDLMDMIKMLEWCMENNIEKVRIVLE